MSRLHIRADEIRALTTALGAPLTVGRALDEAPSALLDVETPERPTLRSRLRAVHPLRAIVGRVVGIRDDADLGRRRERVLRESDQLRLVYCALSEAHSGAHPVGTAAEHGGTVANAYSYRAYTDRVGVVALRNGDVLVDVETVSANKATLAGHALVGPVYDKRRANETLSQRIVECGRIAAKLLAEAGA